MVQVIDLTVDDSMMDETVSEVDETGSENSADNDTANSLRDDDILTEIKSRLGECLLNPNIGGEITYFKVLRDPVNPGIHIKGLGVIGLPLSPYDVDRIIKTASAKKQTSAFCEIPSKQFHLKNPAWRKFVDKVVKQASVHMGFGDNADSILVQPVKMIIESISKLKSPKPLSMNLKTPMQIGTLAICLPCVHSGGDVCFSRGGQKTQFGTSESSEFDCSVFSWFSDVAVELKPVTLGFRLILVYSITQSRKGCAPSASLIQGTKNDIFEALNMWKSAHESPENDVPGILAWVLEEQAEDKSLSLSGLKDPDIQLVNMLKDLCTQSGVYVYLANVTKTVEGTCDSPDERDYNYRGYVTSGNDIVEMLEQTGVSFSLGEIVNLDGVKFSNNMSISLASIIQEDDDPFGLEPASGDWEDDYANHYYHATAIIMVLSSYRTKLFLSETGRYNANIKSIMESEIQAFRDSAGNLDAKEQLLGLSQYIMAEFRRSQTQSYSRFSDEDIDIAAKSSILAGEPDLDFDLSVLSEETYCDIGAAVSHYGFTFLQTTLTAGIAKVTKFHTRISILTKVENACKLSMHPTKNVSTVDRKVLSSWARIQTELGLKVCSLQSAQDALCSLEVSCKYGPQFLVTSVLPAAKKNVEFQNFSYVFLDVLFKTHQTDAILKNAALRCFRDVLSDLIPHSFNMINVDRDADKIEKQDDFPYQNIALIIDCCFSAGLSDDLDVLVTHLIQEVAVLVESTYEDSQAVISILERSVIPLLQNLTGRLTTMKKFERVEQSSLGKLFSKIIDHYIRVLLNPRPKIGPCPKNWKKPAKGCGCAQCIKLDFFLVDPRENQVVFQALKPHLKDQLNRGTDRYNEVFQFETLTTTRPHGLRITKTHDAWNARDKAWRRSCKDAAGSIRGLWKVFGDGKKGDQHGLGEIMEGDAFKNLERVAKGLKVM